ncbi:hypothetical protein DSL72_001139 [Monilinia vaccinii-corymbosi]|uniref:Uncharacterized protein n=1 Tax=Monilinia vaccinii-corymbosi TaxID=61207 RepID=A0A8A3P387_9HELO|nr:hypothetical protein DSL72_001139 [Monilinia vaccinii-corymbosi]
MPASSLHKRKSAEVSDDDLKTASGKVIKLERFDVEGINYTPFGEPATTRSANFESSIPASEKSDLHSHIADLYKFIIGERLLSAAPIKIQKLINMDPASRDFYQTSIRAWIDKEKAELCKAYELEPSITTNFSGTKKYLTDIERLSHMSQGLPIAFDLALYLCESSYVETKDGKIKITGRYNIGPSDHLVRTLCLRMKNEDANFRPAVHLSRINGQRKFFAEDSSGLVQHLLRARDLLVSWVEGPSAAHKIHDDTKRRILYDYGRIVLKLQSAIRSSHFGPAGNANIPGHLVSSVEKSIPQVKRLLYMAGGKKLAFDLLLFAGRHSYIECNRNPLGRKITEGFDKVADSLLLQISKAIREEDPSFRPVDAMEMLHEEIETTRYFGYFPQSYELFSSWMPEVGKAHVQQDYDDLRTKIINAHAAVERRLEVFVKDGSRPTIDLLGRRMCGFIDDINKLSKKLGGLLPAIEIVLFLGECSYTKMEGLGPLYGWEKGTFNCKREFDPLGDDCLEALLQQVQNANLLLNKGSYDRMQKSIEYLKPYGITTYFSLSYGLLGELVGRRA